MLRVAALLLALALPTPAQTPATRPALDVPIEKLAFLAGHWTSETEEEYWSAPKGDNIVGTYRVIKDGKPTFYEFWTIEMEDGTPVYKMKHFNANLKGWEDKDEYVKLPVTEASRNAVTFSDGKITLHYERRGDELTSTLTRTVHGKLQQDEFHLRRAR